MYPYFVEAILLQWISGYSSGLHCVSSENFVFIWTHLTYFLPFSSLNALSWVQIEFSLVSVQSFRIHVFILVRWVLNNATYVLEWQWTPCVRVTWNAWKNAHWPVAWSVATLRGRTLTPSLRGGICAGSDIEYLSWIVQ